MVEVGDLPEHIVDGTKYYQMADLSACIAQLHILVFYDEVPDRVKEIEHQALAGRTFGWEHDPMGGYNAVNAAADKAKS